MTAPSTNPGVSAEEKAAVLAPPIHQPVPLCVQCRHSRDAERYRLCAHPEAPVSPVDGTPTQSCMVARFEGRPCGPAGVRFAPLSGVGDGVQRAA